MENSAFVIFWDGISALSQPNESVYLSTVEWMKNISSQLFIHSFYTGNPSTCMAHKKSVKVVIGYHLQFLHLLVINATPPFCEVLFLSPLFTPLRNCLENRSSEIRVINSDYSRDIHQLFVQYFKIPIHGFETLIDDSALWSEYVLRKNISDYIKKSILTVLNKAKKPEYESEVQSIISTLSFISSDPRFLKIEEKRLLHATLEVLFKLFVWISNPCTDPHLKGPDSI